MQWKYEDYSKWSRTLAKHYTKDELTKRLRKLENEKEHLSESSLRAIQRTTSMQSNSQARAQTGNALGSNYLERQAVKDAIEIIEVFDNRAKNGTTKKRNR